MRARPILKPRCAACRRKRCDYERPRCSACAVSNIDCDYRQNTVFVEFQPKPTKQQRTKNGDNKAAQVARRIASRGSCPVSSLSPNLAYALSLKDGFLARYYPSDTRWWKHCCSWVQFALHEIDFAPLTTAGVALGANMMGTSRHDQHRKQYSVECYGKAMGQLRYHCQYADSKDWFSVFLTCLFLHLYEMMHPLPHTSNQPAPHSLGLASIVRLAGPAAFQRGHHHQAFKYSRVVLITTSLITDTATFLDTDKWLRIPWLVLPKDDQQQCLDIVARLPRLRVTLREVLSRNIDHKMNMTPDHTVAVLSCDLITLAHSMTAWWANFQSRRPDLFEKNDADIYESGAEARALPQNMCNIGDISVLLFYSIFRLLCHDVAWQLACYRQPEPAPLSFLDMNALESQGRIAVEILAGLVEYCTRDDQGIVGVLCLGWPLQLAVQFCQRVDDQRLLAMLNPCFPSISVERQLDSINNVKIVE